MKETKITLFFKKKLFNGRKITLQYCDGSHHHSCMMVHRSTWISLRYTCVPFIPKPLQLPSLPYHPCKLLQSTGFGCSSHASNSPWLSILRMVIYMFQCYCLKSSHPLLLPLSPKVCSLCLHLLCCPARRITGTIFLDSISALIYDICLCLSYLLLISPFQCWVCQQWPPKYPCFLS